MEIRGVYIKEELLKLDLSMLLMHGVIRKNKRTSGLIALTGISDINYMSVYNQEEKYIKLIYDNSKDHLIGNYHYDQMIELTTVQSNLGKGEVIYFICPVTKQKARILFWNPDDNLWESRFAFEYGFYYKSQLCNKLSYHEDMYWSFEEQLLRLNHLSQKEHYKGKPTRLKQRINNLESKKSSHEFLMLISYLQLCHIIEYPRKEDLKKIDYYCIKYQAMMKYLANRKYQ
jgi:hypothetical protein